MSDEIDLEIPQVPLEVGASETLVHKWAKKIYFIRGQMLSRVECLKMASEMISEAKQEVQENNKNA